MITVLAKHELIDERKLLIPDPDQLKRDLSYCSEMRTFNVMGRKGWSKDKENLSESAWSSQIYWQVMGIADKEKDPVERDKIRERLLKQFSKFKTR